MAYKLALARYPPSVLSAARFDRTLLPAMDAGPPAAGAWQQQRAISMTSLSALT